MHVENLAASVSQRCYGIAGNLLRAGCADGVTAERFSAARGQRRLTVEIYTAFLGFAV